MNNEHSLDKDYWNQRYLNDNFGWDLGAISTPLKNYFDGLQDKNLKILIPGAGHAYEAEYLHQNGFRKVYVCDFAQTALDTFKSRCPGFPEEHLLLADFFELTEQGFDLMIEQTFFCAIDPRLRRSYFEKVHKLLKPGGRLVGLLFEDELNKDMPPFGGRREIYKPLFNDLFQVHRFETCYNSVKPREGRELFINLVNTPAKI
ncbi:MAG TPA: methyltransferase domain-containing protein [Bacteroidia bacterium]|nr:methyltransferase domain-containing protein [Bacteroidia bacterium]